MNIANINLKVMILDSDYYALQAVNSYLAWDRRTRVTYLAESLEHLWEAIYRMPLAEHPDVIIMDADHMGGPEALRQVIARLRERISRVMIVCLAQHADSTLIESAADAGARAYFLKGEVRSHIAWAIVYAIEHNFVVTPGIARAGSFNSRVFHAQVLPRQRDYPELTDRIRQAIELCVVKGMPAQVAADEMGISLHTIRSYIKEGYRILEAYDETEYPVDMSPQERAFMRITRLSDEE